jgi:hypothetical protein
MRKSQVVDIDGVFIGAAIPVEEGYRFVAVDGRLRPLNERVWPTLADIQRLARLLLSRTGQPAPIPALA